MFNDPMTYTATRRGRHVEHLDDETLIYDVGTDHVLRLTPDAAHVWEACDAGATPAAIADRTGIGAARVDQALAELGASDLVEVTGPAGMTRRSFAAKAGLGVAAVAGVALVTSMAAPTPASAESSNGGGNGGGGNGGGGNGGGGNGGGGNGGAGNGGNGQ